MASDTKQRMVESAAKLLQGGGVSAAAFTDVVTASGAARGAIYHHFPGGKTELVRDAVEWTALRVRGELALIDGADPQEIVAGFLARVRPVVVRATVGVSCAVAAVTVESAPTESVLVGAVRDAFQAWVDELDTQLRRVGASEPAARSMAILLITFLEGTQVLCRAAGDVAAFDLGATALVEAARALRAE